MFKDRQDAGIKLGRKIKKLLRLKKNLLVLAIPRGGVPVGYEVAKMLKCKFDAIMPRKLPIPYEPEAGFGAVIDNIVVLNKKMLSSIKLSQQQINSIIKEVKEEILRRTMIYRGNIIYPSLKDKIVILVDDGLASGYTMLAAIKWLRKQKVKCIIVAVPVSSASAAEEIKEYADQFICINVRNVRMFAVADSYEKWHDLTDEEVINLLKK